MIISVTNLRKYITTSLSDPVLEEKLQALESMIRKYTNNNFQNTNIRVHCNASSAGLGFSSNFLKVGDTVQVSQSKYNDGLYVIQSVAAGLTVLNKTLYDETNILVTKVEYPSDIVMGVVDMISWDLNNRDKVGIQSETISRHSVTYFNMDGQNSVVGYPKAIVGFLDQYKKARF